MKKRLFYIAAASLALVSCNEEELVQVPANQVNGVLTVAFEQDGATRTNITSTTNEGKTSNILAWSEGDEIAVFGESAVKYTISDKNNGTFKVAEGVEAPAEITGVAFPYSEDVSLSENTLTMTLPSVIDQTTAGELDLPMWATVSGGNITLKHLAGVLKVNLSDVPEGYNTLTVTADKPISGTFTATTTETNPVLASTSTDEADKTVTVNFTAATSSILYLPLPIGDYSSIVVSVSGEENGSKVLKQWTNRSVARAQVYATSVTDYTSVMTEAELRAAVAKGGEVKLGANIELTQPLTIDNAKLEVSIDLGTYSLTNKTECDYDDCGETECYVFEVKDGTLNITGTTGSVDAIAGSDYDMAVFANTNGKVNISGGKFTNLGKENDGSDLIYVRDNASVAISGGEFAAGNKSSDVGNQYVALNLRDADRKAGTCSIAVTGGRFHKFNPANNVSEGSLTNFTAANTMVAVSGTEGAEVYEVINLASGYTLTSNVEIATPITINTTGTIAINLDSYSLTNKTAYDYDNCGETECYVFEVQSGTLDITGTTGSVDAIAGSGYDMAVFANNSGIVNISGGKFTNLGKVNDGSDLIYVRDNASVAISGGEFAAGNMSSDVGNQYVALNLRDGDRETASITVTGGRFHKFDPANNVSEGANTNFVAEGYSSALVENDYYVVTPTTAQE